MKYFAGACWGIAGVTLIYGVWTHFVDSPAAFGLYFAVPAIIFTVLAENK